MGTARRAVLDTYKKAVGKTLRSRHGYHVICCDGLARVDELAAGSCPSVVRRKASRPAGNSAMVLSS